MLELIAWIIVGLVCLLSGLALGVIVAAHAKGLHRGLPDTTAPARGEKARIAKTSDEDPRPKR